MKWVWALVVGGPMLTMLEVVIVRDVIARMMEWRTDLWIVGPALGAASLFAYGLIMALLVRCAWKELDKESAGGRDQK